MAETVRLTVLTGPHKGRRFCFRGPARCLVGRADDCFMRFAGTRRDQKISRHHCELHMDPPAVRVRDLGSRNGTYVNGHPVDGPDAGQEPGAGDVQSGDVITIGGTSFRADVVDCPDHPALDRDPGWADGEVALADCPVPCPSDGAAPPVGCCAGGLGGMA